MRYRAGIHRLPLFVLLCGLAVAILVISQTNRARAQTDDLNCEDFSSQEEAQAELESDPSDPNNLDADNDGIACETFDYGSGGGGGGGSDLDCADFGSQEDAQAELDSDPSDPNNLDADNDGEACEDFDYGGSAGGYQYDDGNGDDGNGKDDDDDDNNGDDQYGDDDVIDDSVPDKDLPNTGGSAVGGLVFAGLFLAFSSALILHRLKRN